MVWKDNIANKVGDTTRREENLYSREWFQKLFTAFALYVLFCCWSLMPLIRCVQAFYGRHVSQKYDKLQPNLKQFEERKPSQYNSSSEMIFKWSGLLTITFGPSILMWMFGKKWPLYQKEMFFYASPNYIHSWLDPEDLMKIRLHTWNHTAEMIPLCLKCY